MNFLKSLSGQIIAAIVLVLVVGLLALLIMAGSQMSTMTIDSFVHQQEATVLAMANGLADPLHSIRGDDDDDKVPNIQARLQPRLKTDATALGGDISLIGPNNETLATTRSTPCEIGPEVPTALRGNIASDLRDGVLYVAAPIRYERHVIALVRLDVPFAPVEAELRGRWLALIGAAGGALALACVVGWWLSMRIIHPLTAVRTVAEQMAAGRFNVRADVPPNNREVTALGEAFNTMAQYVEGVLTRQRDFVANASHELRSPLAAIKIRSEALANGIAEGEFARQYAAEINEEVSRLAQLVADLLYLSRVDNRAVIPPTEPLNIHDELRACVRAIHASSTAKRQYLDVQIDEGIPDLYIHSNDLRIMVINLLDNAVKYTPEEGHITLAAHWKDDTLSIAVDDSGEGIPPADLHRVTERFFRVDRSHARSTPGTGLGLSLVQAVAQQYSGMLNIRSNGVPGQGSHVSVSLKPAAA
ncbi:MAG: HAMP domain-containing protein [Anaerolineae bacterium]|nr:HAMP domain-containing protein [Anaerolineae bacterium]